MNWIWCALWMHFFVACVGGSQKYVINDNFQLTKAKTLRKHNDNAWLGGYGISSEWVVKGGGAPVNGTIVDSSFLEIDFNAGATCEVNFPTREHTSYFLCFYWIPEEMKKALLCKSEGSAVRKFELILTLETNTSGTEEESNTFWPGDFFTYEDDNLKKRDFYQQTVRTSATSLIMNATDNESDLLFYLQSMNTRADDLAICFAVGNELKSASLYPATIKLKNVVLSVDVTVNCVFESDDQSALPFVTSDGSSLRSRNLVWGALAGGWKGIFPRGMVGLWSTLLVLMGELVPTFSHEKSIEPQETALFNSLLSEDEQNRISGGGSEVKETTHRVRETDDTQAWKSEETVSEKKRKMSMPKWGDKELEKYRRWPVADANKGERSSSHVTFDSGEKISHQSVTDEKEDTSKEPETGLERGNIGQTSSSNNVERGDPFLGNVGPSESEGESDVDSGTRNSVHSEDDHTNAVKSFSKTNEEQNLGEKERKSERMDDLEEFKDRDDWKELVEFLQSKDIKNNNDWHVDKKLSEFYANHTPEMIHRLVVHANQQIKISSSSSSQDESDSSLAIGSLPNSDEPQSESHSGSVSNHDVSNESTPSTPTEESDDGRNPNGWSKKKKSFFFVFGFFFFVTH